MSAGQREVAFKKAALEHGIRRSSEGTSGRKVLVFSGIYTMI